MLYLRALGGLYIENGGRPLEGAANQRARLALLAILAASGRRGISRDRLLALFWPEKDVDAAQGALRQALYTLRRDAQEPALTLGTTDVRLNPEAIGSDVGDFNNAIVARDFETAVERYGGPFLDGIHLHDVPEFDRWVERERERKTGQYRDALEQLAGAARTRGDHRAAVEWHRKLTASDPLSARRVVSLMNALVNWGDRPAAVQCAREYERVVRAELEVAPDPSVVTLAEEIRATPGPEMPARDTSLSADEGAVPRALSENVPKHASRSARGNLALGTLVAAGLCIALLSAFPRPRTLGIAAVTWPFSRARTIPSKPVLVADVRVSAADSALGGVITEVLRTGLGQSSTITVMPQSLVASALQRMQRPANSRVNAALAREIAQREGIPLLVDGDVTPLTDGSVLTVRLIAVASGDVLTSFHQTVTGARDLIPVLDRVTRALRVKIGESLATVNASLPLEQVTTPSLEALQKYVEAARAQELDVDYPRSIRLLREAIALDSSFAMAHRKLGTVLNHLGRPRAESDSAYARAYRFRDRLTDQERLHTTAYYYLAGPGRDRARAAAEYEELLSRYPNNTRALNDLGLIYFTRREYARAETLYRRIPAAAFALYRRPQWNPNLIDVLFAQGKVAAAESALVLADHIAPHAPQRFDIALPVIQVSYGLDSVARFLDAGRNDSDPMARASATKLRGEVALIRGQLSEARALWAIARAIDSSRGTAIPAHHASVRAAWMDVWFRGRNHRALATLDAAMTRLPLGDATTEGELYFRTASVYALAGRPDKARAVLARYRADVHDTAQLREEEPASRVPLAEIALAERRPLDAVREFRQAEMAPDGPASECTICTYARLARAFDAAAMPDSAVAYFERYVHTPDPNRIHWSSLEASVDGANLGRTYRRLAELHDAAGHRQQAALYYGKFVELWRNADPELQPSVAAARARLASLGDGRLTVRD